MLLITVSCDGEDCNEEIEIADTTMERPIQDIIAEYWWKTVQYTDRDYHYCRTCANKDN